ncbi:carcinoembryonic antigen-related cell adhesion molecule 2-like [Eleutherodactylus coqui]|uniref:carcinoembryonic antigen-related cell adhesion molecule 2-like n=1 Tax=Eleutherodactylus coqui TaxID=57060 RepID=UPI0034618FDE
MLPAPATALRIGLLLCVLRATASSFTVVSFPAGDTVTLSCSDETNTTRNLSDVTQIVWRKVDGSRSLHFAWTSTNNISNFTDSRISFQSAQPPTVLRIRDVQTGDAGNYTCHITDVQSGNLHRSWTLQISESNRSDIIYISSSVTGGIILLMLLAGIIYYMFYSKRNTIPSQIHQTSPENNAKEEPVYDNIHEEYFLRFNTLYDRMPPEVAPRSPDDP